MNTQINEDYVSFETAKLLKEKGYKGSFNGYYNNAGCVVDKPNTLLKEPEYQYYERVSLYMAMKWLREVHHYYIQVMLDSWALNGHFGYYVVIQKTDSDFNIMLQDYVDNVFYQNYEEAAEAAIKYCLTNLI